MAKGFFLLLLFAASHSHSATSESVISVNDGKPALTHLQDGMLAFFYVNSILYEIIKNAQSVFQICMSKI